MVKSSVHSTQVDFRLLFESVPGLYLVLTPGLIIAAVSDAYLKATRTKRNEIMGKYIFDVFTENTTNPASTDVSNLKASLNYVLKSKKSDTIPLQNGGAYLSEKKTTATHQEKHWGSFNSPVLNADGKVAYIIHRLEDVTEAINSEISRAAERKKNAEILEQKNNALLYSQAELDSFSYSVSHDLRAPLRAIYGYTKIVSDTYMDRLDEEAREMMDKTMKNVKKMGQLIDGLLAFARVGKKEIVKTDINMTHLVQKTLMELKQYDFPEKTKINITHLPPAIGDYGMLGQVLTSLISNAIKFSSTKEQPVIEIGSLQKDGADIYYVKDNGAGFEMKYYNKLFHMFQCLHNYNEIEGNGVGLALVKRVITKHGGRVWAESEIGKGATFYFSLPA